MQQPRVNEPSEAEQIATNPKANTAHKNEKSSAALSGLPRLVSSRLSSHANYTLFKIRVAN